MTRTKLHALTPESARKRIKAAKSNETFITALMERDHRGHKDAVEHWTKLHEVAFPASSPPSMAQAKTPRRGGLLRVSATVSDPHADVGNAAPAERIRTRVKPIKRRLRDEVGDDDGPIAPSDGDEVPTLNMESDRTQALVENLPARFEIRENPNADPNYGAWRAIHSLGVDAVQQHEGTIERLARAQGVDPDLVKAIMYVENAHGAYGHPLEALGLAESLFPMNIRPDPWAAMQDPPADLSDPEVNIRIAVTLIRRITERIDDPTPAKVASIWNFTGREAVNEFGARVQDVYRRQLWK